MSGPHAESAADEGAPANVDGWGNAKWARYGRGPGMRRFSQSLYGGMLDVGVHTDHEDFDAPLLFRG